MKTIKLITGLAALCCTAVTSQATITTLTANGIETSMGSVDTYTANGATLSSPFAATSPGLNISGTAVSWAGTSAANPFGAGDLTLFYQITMNSTPPDTEALDSFTVSGFKGYSVAVDYSASGGAYAPLDASLSNGRVKFFFSGTGNNDIPAGGESDLLVVFTSASASRGTANASFQDSVTANTQVLSVPEPTTIVAGVMLLLPFGASTLRFFRKSTTV